MKLSTRSRYGMRAIVDITRHQESGPVSLKEIAERQGVSTKYMEHVVARLLRRRLVSSRRGAHGGYMLSRSPEEITAKEVVHALEGTPMLIQCVSKPERCGRSASCVTRQVWGQVEDAIDAALDSITIADLATGKGLPQRCRVRR